MTSKIDELIAQAVKPLNEKHSAKIWLNSAVKCFEEAVSARDNKRYDESFMFFNRAFDIIVRVVPKSKGFDANDFQYLALKKKVKSYLELCEEVKKIILENSKEEKLQSAFAPSNVSPSLSSNNLPSPYTSPALKSIEVRSRHPSSSSTSSFTGNSTQPNIPFTISQQNTTQLPTMPILPAVLPPQYVSTQMAVIKPEFLIEYMKNTQSLMLQKILIIDLRPVDQFMMGHIKWKPKMVNGNFAGGIVNIDPDWLTTGISSDKIFQLLQQFKMTSWTPIKLFEQRDQFDLVVLYDENSTTPARSSNLATLSTVMYDWEIKKKLKSPPVMLQGGMVGWSAYVKNAKLNQNDWVEFGDDLDQTENQNTGIVSAISPTFANLSLQPQISASQYISNNSATNFSQISSLQYQPNSGVNQLGMNGQFNQGDGLLRNPYDFVQGRTNPYSTPSVSNSIPLQTYPKVDSLTSFTPAFHSAHQRTQYLNGLQSQLQSQQQPITPVQDKDVFNSLNSFNMMSSLPRRRSSVVNAQPITQPSIAYPRLTNNVSALTSAQVSGVASQQKTITTSTTPTPTPVLLSPIVAPQPAVLPRQANPSKPTGRAPPPLLPPKPASLAPLVYERSMSPTHQYYGSNRAIAPTTINTIDLNRKLDNNVMHGTVGLRNLGNTCFMNSVIQCLAGTVPLTRYFYDGSYKRHINRANPLGTKGLIVDVYNELIRAMNSEDRVVAPVKFKAKFTKDVVGQCATQFMGNEQQDSQEFLGFLLDKLHEDLNVARKNKLKPAPINNNSNSNADIDDEPDMVSTTFDHFMYLSLPIPAKGRNQTVTLEECINKFCEEEILDGNDSWMCPRCKKPRKASKKLDIIRLPAILLVHLKRFYYQGPFRNKIETSVDFPLVNLDLTKYTPVYGRTSINILDSSLLTLDVPTVTGYNETPSTYVYDLYAVSNHFGGLNGGHYTAQVRNMHRDTWENFDDSHVTQCNPESVKSRAAYILFFVRQVEPGVRSVTGSWWSKEAKM
ncbi:ubiquitin-specific protease doa4 [Nowakowskiella sp. JEL0078]|nr:ubiquitin-specific protease doa4 [Nowakowskiella sp. JEL0078]